MRRLFKIVAVPLLFALNAAAAPGDPAFRLVGFDAASVPKVTAILDTRTGAAGSPPVSASDFVLLEDGIATTPAVRTQKFRDTGLGLALIVAIDVSPSMEGRPLNAIRKGLAQLVSRKRDQDRITVLSFADNVRWETRWDASATAMQDAFRGLRARGNSTRLYDAVGQAMDELAAESKQDPGFPSRMCILVLSDGHDEGSRATLGQVAGRLRGSRVRLDAVGLAHSPFWLSNLQTLASAGFGGFRAASTPESLTNLLGQGIDALLDMPAYEFKTEHAFGDGRSHLLGVEYLPEHWRDQVAVKLPKRPWFEQQRWLLAIGIAALLLLAAALYFGLRTRAKPAVPVAHVPSQPPPAPAPVHRRTETVAESALDRPAIARPASFPTAAETFAAAPPADFAAPPKPARVGTVLAPQASAVSASSALIVEAGPYAGHRFALSTGDFWIGSSPNNQLCLSADAAVSGNHACIRREERFYRLYDNDSLNNTLINGRAIGREVVLLQNGDRIRIGQSELRLEL
jgi:Mg-chelatase subunit ChlD